MRPYGERSPFERALSDADRIPTSEKEVSVVLAPRGEIPLSKASVEDLSFDQEEQARDWEDTREDRCTIGVPNRILGWKPVARVLIAKGEPRLEASFDQVRHLRRDRNEGDVGTESETDAAANPNVPGSGTTVNR